MSKFTNPDFAKRLKGQVRVSNEIFGTNVEWRRYISSSGGMPELGYGDSAMFQARPARWMLGTPDIEEIQTLGGNSYQGMYMVQSVDQIDARDEMKFSGNIYRCVSQPRPAHIGGDLYYRAIFALSKSTGKF